MYALFSNYTCSLMSKQFFFEFYEHTCHVRSMNRTAWRLEKVNKFDTNFHKRNSYVLGEARHERCSYVLFCCKNIIIREDDVFIQRETEASQEYRKADNLSIIILQSVAYTITIACPGIAYTIPLQAKLPSAGNNVIREYGCYLGMFISSCMYFCFAFISNTKFLGL